MDFPPFGGGKSFVRRLIRHKRIFLFAGHPAQAMGHEPQELNRQGGLRFEAPGWIAQPMFGDAAKRTKCIGQFNGNIGLAAVLCRLEIGGERPAGLFQETRQIM